MDVAAVKEAKCTVAQKAQIAATDSARTRDGMAAFTRLSKERIGMMHQTVNGTQKTRKEFFNDFADLHASETLEYHLIN